MIRLTDEVAVSDDTSRIEAVVWNAGGGGVSGQVCRTCGHVMTDREREDYVDQCGPCVLTDHLSAWGIDATEDRP